MRSQYLIYGAEQSPYSVKVRSYFRFKAIPHVWLIRNQSNQAEYEKYARLPLIPLVVTPDDEGLQDSTPIMEQLETYHSEPSVHPSDPITRFISILLEEFADEWGNKWMFHYRWAREVDQLSASKRLAHVRAQESDEQGRAQMAEKIRERMTNRVFFVGSNEQTAPQIEASFHDSLDLLEAHLAERRYLFGDRPGLADFGLAAQIYSARTDPTPAAFLESRYPNVLGWLQRMHWPRVEGDFESWQILESTLMPLLERQVGQLFLPWSQANAVALASEQDSFSVELKGRTWTQKPQKYHAKSLMALRDKFANLEDRAGIESVLARAGCLNVLAERV